jgi:hypothetical protein
MVEEEDRRDDNRVGETPAASGRETSKESNPTESGHSTADDQARRNQEDESPA